MSPERPIGVLEGRDLHASLADIQRILRRGGLRSPKTLKHHALQRFASLPRHVRILWFMAAFETLTIAMRALES
jgi:hypothetical protein